VAPVLPALGMPEPGRLIDVGSGNGSPGLVFAVLRADLEVTLLEPRVRRWAFLREAARATGAARVSVLRQRHDVYAGPPARTLTVRALALPLVELGPLVEAGGRVLWFGARAEASGPFEPAGDGERLTQGVQVFRRLG